MHDAWATAQLYAWSLACVNDLEARMD